MQTPNHFIKTQNRLNTAIDKVKTKLSTYSAEAAKIEGNWTEEHHVKFADWNNLHDLQHRLENRLKNNYADYEEWHFDTFGWMAIGAGLL